MMNFIALSLIATSFLVSGLFSPNPIINNNNGDQVIVKDGHRAVVVEYADVTGDGNTKVSISPPHQAKVPGPDEEGLGRATASVVGVAEDVKGKAEEAMHVHGGPRELICDAYGKCKHKVAGVLSRAKEKAVEKAVEAEETVEEKVGEAVDKVKGFASKGAEKVGEKIEDVKRGGEKVKEKAEEKVKETGEMVKEKAEDLVEETKEKGKKGKKEISDIAKRGKEVVIDVLGYVFGADSIGSLMNLLGLGVAYGSGIWVTFVMSYVLAIVLPRQQFGVVQSKVYPVYFKVMVGSIGLSLLGHLLGQRSKVFKSKPEILQGYNLMTSLLMVLGNSLFLEPRATKVMFQRMKLEKEEGRGIDGRGTPAKVVDAAVTDSTVPAPTTTTRTTVTETPSVAATEPPTRTEQDAAKSKLVKLDGRLKKLNSYSSLLNIMTLMGLTWHLVYLSQRLGATT